MKNKTKVCLLVGFLVLLGIAFVNGDEMVYCGGAHCGGSCGCRNDGAGIVRIWDDPCCFGCPYNGMLIICCEGISKADGCLTAAY